MLRDICWCLFNKKKSFIIEKIYIGLNYFIKFDKKLSFNFIWKGKNCKSLIYCIMFLGNWFGKDKIFKMIIDFIVYFYRKYVIIW